MKLDRRSFVKQVSCGIAMSMLPGCRTGQSLFSSNQTSDTRKQPNLIIFMSDDHGYNDLSCMSSSDIRTPHLDRIASKGMLLTNWYANSPICAPSRAALLSGKYPVYAGMNVNVKTAKHNTGLPLQTPTLAEALNTLGYQTSIFGKWHIGANEAHWPINRGFDYWFGMKGGCVDFFSHILYYEEPSGLPPIHDLYENGQRVWKCGSYLTELITEHAVRYFNKIAKNNPEKPFFTFISHAEPHYPMHVPQKYRDRFPDLPWERQIMAAKISALDDSVGEIMETLKKNGQLDNTLVFFMSDNGPSIEIRNWLDETVTPYYGGGTGGFRGHKMSLFEGGIRVPAIVSWPGKIPQDKVVHEVGSAIDIFPTFLKAAGGNPEEYALDGKNLLPMLMEGKPSPHETLFFEFQEQIAVRRGKWKLVLNGRDVEGVSPEDKIHLADLSSPRGDTVNVRDQYPEITEELKDMAETWHKKATAYYDKKWKPVNVDQRSYPPYYMGPRTE